MISPFIMQKDSYIKLWYPSLALLHLQDQCYDSYWRYMMPVADNTWTSYRRDSSGAPSNQNHKNTGIVTAYSFIYLLINKNTWVISHTVWA